MAGLRLRWLGVAGFELTLAEDTLAIDPFLTRPPLRYLWLGRARPDEQLAAAQLPYCDHVLVSHSHWDHLFDVPAVLARTGASAWGSANTCRLLGALGAAPEQLHEVHTGDRLSLGGFEVDVLPSVHPRLCGWPPFAGKVPLRPRPPAHLGDFLADDCFCFLVEAGAVRLLHWGSERPGPAPPADILCVGVQRPDAYYAALLRAVRPRVVIPMHWDDFFSPLSRPLRPMLAPPRPALPPLRRMDPRRFQRAIAHLDPAANVIVPDILRAYELNELLA